MSSPHRPVPAPTPDVPPPSRFATAFALPTGIVLLVIWIIGLLTTELPGWFHIFLTAGVFLIIWGIVARGTRRR